MLIPDRPTIRSLMPQALDFPILRKSVDIDSLPESEKHGFLQEAEKKKGLPADACRLVAVFRHVPIELISRLHYLNDDKAIEYTIAGGINRSRTRVYDVMVVRDDSMEIHLLPHGAKYRMVGLN